MAVFTGNGAVGSPSFTFSSDTNTGIYRPAADELSVTTNGTNSAKFDSSQRLLVGLTFSGQTGASLVANSQIFAPNVIRNDVNSVFGQVSTATTDAYEIDLAGRGSRYLAGVVGDDGKSPALLKASGFIGIFRGDQTVPVRFIDANIRQKGLYYKFKIKVGLSHTNAGAFDYLEKEYVALRTVVVTSGFGLAGTPIWTSTKPGNTNGTLDFSVGNPSSWGISQGAAPYWCEFDLTLTSGRSNALYFVAYEFEGYLGSSV
jgi:hypothetical protein